MKNQIEIDNEIPIGKHFLLMQVFFKIYYIYY